MGTSLSLYAGSDTLTASGLISRMSDIEDYLNGGIVAGDYGSTAWVDSGIVIRPDFIPFPNRVVLQSCDVNHNTRPNDKIHGFVLSDDVLQGAWTTIPGLWRTVDVQPPRSETTADVILRACFYTYEQEGAGTSGTFEAAKFGLWKDPDEDMLIGGWDGERRVYNSGSPTVDKYRQYHMMEARWNDVTRGRHEFGVGMYMHDNGSRTTRNWKFVWVKAASIIVRVVYR